MSTEFDPPDQDAYNAKSWARNVTSGYGIAGVRMTMPCPGCAEPDFLSTLLIESEQAFTVETVCSKCGRGFRSIYDRTPVSFEVVQTRGDELPAYLPRIRRVEAE